MVVVAVVVEVIEVVLVVVGMLDVTAKEAHSVDAAIPKSHNLHSTVTERLQQYTDWKGELTRIHTATENGLYSTTTTNHNSHCTVPNKLRRSLEQLNFRPSHVFECRKQKYPIHAAELENF